MGIRQTGIPIGGALAAAVLPVIALTAGWRWAIALSGLASLLAGLLCLIRYPPPSLEEGVAARRLPAPGFRALLTRDVALLGLAGAFLPLGQFALVTYLALYLFETQQVPVTHSAALLVGAQIAGAAGRVLWGVISDRWLGGRRKPALMMAGGLSALGALIIGLMPSGTPLWIIALVVTACAFNAIGWHGTWISLVAEIAGPERQGRTIGVAMTVMYAGIIALPPLFGFYVDLTHAWTGAWVLLALGLLLGTLLVLPVREFPPSQ